MFIISKILLLFINLKQIGFEYISYQLGLIESFWRFVVNKYEYSVPLLIVGNTREPNILFDQSHINFNAVLVGHQVSKTVLLINQEASTSISSTTFNDICMNNEEQSSNIFEFEFLKSSLHSAGKQDSIIVEPMSGYIPPGTKYVIDVTSYWFLSISSLKCISFWKRFILWAEKHSKPDVTRRLFRPVQDPSVLKIQDTSCCREHNTFRSTG